jgi:hypothetical protein
MAFNTTPIFSQYEEYVELSTKLVSVPYGNQYLNPEHASFSLPPYILRHVM